MFCHYVIIIFSLFCVLLCPLGVVLLVLMGLLACLVSVCVWRRRCVLITCLLVRGVPNEGGSYAVYHRYAHARTHTLTGPYVHTHTHILGRHSGAFSTNLLDAPSRIYDHLGDNSQQLGTAVFSKHTHTRARKRTAT